MPENDRVDNEAAKLKLPKPEIEIIVDGNAVYKPGMKSYLYEPKNDSTPTKHVVGSKGYVVGGTVCVCDTVKTSSSSSSSGCSAYKSSGGSGGSRCSCNKVCTCNKVT